MKNPHSMLEKEIGYKFRKRSLLVAALTHPSFRYEDPDVDSDNQRLEFLGDAALGLVSAAHMYASFPDVREGDLTRMRSRVTSRDALAVVGARLKLCSYLRLGKGEMQTGGHERPSTLADAVEAILGAAYLDGGLKAVEKIFRKSFPPLLQTTLGQPWIDNPKGMLQEYCQQKWKSGPRYQLLIEEGPPHQKSFTVNVAVNGEVLATGSGASKRQAEVMAARGAMEKLLAGNYLDAGAG